MISSTGDTEQSANNNQKRRQSGKRTKKNGLIDANQIGPESLQWRRLIAPWWMSRATTAPPSTSSAHPPRPTSRLHLLVLLVLLLLLLLLLLLFCWLKTRNGQRCHNQNKQRWPIANTNWFHPSQLRGAFVSGHCLIVPVSLLLLLWRKRWILTTSVALTLSR